MPRCFVNDALALCNYEDDVSVHYVSSFNGLAVGNQAPIRNRNEMNGHLKKAWKHVKSPSAIFRSSIPRGWRFLRKSCPLLWNLTVISPPAYSYSF
jgi:hypothetical protein